MERTCSRLPISVPPFLALIKLLAKNATSDSPKFNPYPAIGWILWAASPTSAILLATYESEFVNDKGKAYLFVFTPVIRGGISKSKLFNWLGIMLPIGTSDYSWNTSLSLWANYSSFNSYRSLQSEGGQLQTIEEKLSQSGNKAIGPVLKNL